MKKSWILVTIILMMAYTSALQAQSFTTYTTSEGLADNYVVGGVAVDGNNHVWAGTAAGLSTYDGTNWTTYTTSDGLIDNYILCVTADSSGNIWIGTNAGVSKFDGSNFTNYTSVDGLIDNTVNYVFAEENGTAWFATGAGLSRLSGSTWTSFTTSDGLSSDVITYITGDAGGNIWLGTQMGGYIQFDGATFTCFTTSNTDSLVSDNVFALAINDAGTRFIGSWSGISEINQSGTWIQNIRMGEGLYNNFVRDIKFAPNGDMWVGVFADYNGDGGISCFNGSNWTSWSTPEGLADMQVIRLAPDHDGAIWIATGNGLSRLTGVSSIDDNPDLSRVSVSPNPATDRVYVSVNKQASMVRVYSPNGQTLAEFTPSSLHFVIETSTFDPGVYIIQTIFENQIQSSKLVIQ